jgi:hypothetical protein
VSGAQVSLATLRAGSQNHLCHISAQIALRGILATLAAAVAVSALVSYLPSVLNPVGQACSNKLARYGSIELTKILI